MAIVRGAPRDPWGDSKDRFESIPNDRVLVFLYRSESIRNDSKRMFQMMPSIISLTFLFDFTRLVGTRPWEDKPKDRPRAFCQTADMRRLSKLSVPL